MVQAQHAKPKTMSEDMQFCGTICMSARKLGIVIQEDGNRFIWHDPLGSVIQCLPSTSREKSLVLACEQLVNYLNGGS